MSKEAIASDEILKQEAIASDEILKQHMRQQQLAARNIRPSDWAEGSLQAVLLHVDTHAICIEH